PTAEHDRGSAGARMDNNANRQNFFSSIAEMNDHALKADIAVGHSQFQSSEGSSSDINFVVIRSAIDVRAPQVLPRTASDLPVKNAHQADAEDGQAGD